MITIKRDEIGAEVRAAINGAVARGVIYSGRHEITGAVRNRPSFIDSHVDTLIAATIITPVMVEDLNVKGIMANHRLAKATADAGWGMFTRFLEYKAARAGKAFLKCDRWYPSSKACSECGSIREKMPLDVRTWTCAHCGTHHDRDINAAINIRDEGVRILTAGAVVSASLGSGRPKPRRNPRSKAVPVEARSLRLKAEVVHD